MKMHGSFLSDLHKSRLRYSYYISLPRERPLHQLDHADRRMEEELNRMTAAGGGRGRLCDRKVALCAQRGSVLFQRFAHVADVVGTVLDSFHQAGDGGVFPERADEFDGYAVFLKKADINAAGIVPHPVLHGVVTEREEGRLRPLSLLDKVSDVMDFEVHFAVLSA